MRLSLRNTRQRINRRQFSLPSGNKNELDPAAAEAITYSGIRHATASFAGRPGKEILIRDSTGNTLYCCVYLGHR